MRNKLLQATKQLPTEAFHEQIENEKMALVWNLAALRNSPVAAQVLALNDAAQLMALLRLPGAKRVLDQVMSVLSVAKQLLARMVKLLPVAEKVLSQRAFHLPLFLL